jgi:trehalose-phosphatase
MSADEGLRTPSAATPTHPIEGVLLDMDGVVTDTASAHAAAWKRLFDDYLQPSTGPGTAGKPFDADRDYREYVDGKPRYEGVKSFLESRGIELPEGTEDDEPGDETIVGLGKLKDRHFRAWLANNLVETFPGTLAFLHRAHRLGIRTAVFSSSRNAEDVLTAAGVAHLFDASVDGRDVAERGLPGKPHPAILERAAAKIEVAPKQCAVIEDALVGVAAGASGGFGVIVGVDRDSATDRFVEEGASIVVSDLAELRMSGDRRLDCKTLDTLPTVWQLNAQIESLVARRPIAVFLDYDGTLTPIVADHREARLDSAMRMALAALAQVAAVAIVSGRDLEDLDRRVRLDSAHLAGSHGFEIAGPGTPPARLEKGTEFLADLDAVEAEIRETVGPIEGASVERKRFAIAVHYRQATDRDAARVSVVVERALRERVGLRCSRGKKVFDIQPAIDWHKGRAVAWLLDRIESEGTQVLPIYIGDDITDEHAFRSLADTGLTIAIRDGHRRTSADCALADHSDVLRFVRWLTQRRHEAPK